MTSVVVTDRHRELRLVELRAQVLEVEAVAIDVLGVGREAVRDTGEPVDVERNRRRRRGEVGVDMPDAFPLDVIRNHPCLQEVLDRREPVKPEREQKRLHVSDGGAAKHPGVSTSDNEHLAPADVAHVSTHELDLAVEDAVARLFEGEDPERDPLALQLEQLVQDEGLGEARIHLQDVGDRCGLSAPPHRRPPSLPARASALERLVRLW
jgi:hypothetical protein